jgi:type IV pilus assembly protein PilY1
MKKNIVMTGLWMIVAFFAGFGTVHAVEPNMADYTAYPVFMANTVEPNILIMLDNSGSMNEQAYSDDFGGSAPDCGTATMLTAASEDDAEELLDDNSVQFNTTSLYLGTVPGEPVCTQWTGKKCKNYNYPYFDTAVGLRFPNVEVPPRSTITNAYIKFQAYANGSDAAVITIRGENVGDASAFSASSENVSGRSDIGAAVTWNITDDWFLGSSYDSPDLTAIVQKIVNHGGYESFKAMAFTFTGTGSRSVRSYDFDPGSAPQLVIEYVADCAAGDSARYYGYFDPDARYSHVSNVFVRDPSGAWDGNFLNWLSMRKIDVTRKVLMGGLATSRVGGGNQNLYSQSVTGASFLKKYDGSGVSPYDGSYIYGMDNGKIFVDTDGDGDPFDNDSFTIKVDKDPALDPPEEFHEGKLAGVLQRLGDGKANWGNTWFNDGTGSSESGAFLAAPIGTNLTSMATDLQNFEPGTWTPLAESFYVATRYFEQKEVAAGLDFKAGEPGPFNDVRDPYVQDQEVWCAKSFVLLLTDGASTMDSKLPASLIDMADGHETFLNKINASVDCVESTGVGCEYSNSGSDYLKDVAHYARTTDLRLDIEGEQNIILYAVYAALGGDDPNARNLLKEAARQGGFEDRNGNGWPDGEWDDPDPSKRKEWDKNGDGSPDNYFEATDGYELEAKILAAINDILARAASGTAASVLATNAEGEGNLVQAYFRPTKIEDTVEVNWLGYLQSLWVDPCGNLREDSNQDQRLNLNEDLNSNGLLDGGEDVNGNGVLDSPASEDKIVTYYSDATTSDTLIFRYTSHYLYNHPLDCNGEGDPGDYVYETLGLEEISPIWEVGKVLARRDPDTRRIFTYIDTDNDQELDEGAYVDIFDDTAGEVITFNSDNAAAIKPYLGVMDSGAPIPPTWNYLGATHDDRVSNLIDYIRGTDFDGMRSRTIGGNVWKLGDIVHSTPVTIAAPVDNYHVIYGDQSYQDFLTANRDRETAIYVGANDGMLHAFTSWQYDAENGIFERPAGRVEIGEELWSYIPQALLPHLKWLADPQYTHVYYVDFKPKVFDARIGDPDGLGHPTWRTILICGFNMGGKYIWAEGDFNDGNGLTTRHFYPAYVCMDVTDPLNPKLLWERTYSELGMTRATPAVIRIEDTSRKDANGFFLGDWYTVFGSGPTDYDGSSSQNGYVFVVDLKTGEPIIPSVADGWLFDTGTANTYMNSPSSLDKNLTNSVDAIYFGDTAGNLYHLSTLETQAFDGDGNPLTRSPSPSAIDWTLTNIYSGTQPITASASLSVDAMDSVWVYFGTGSYLTDADKTSQGQQYMIGIRDPLFQDSPSALPLDRVGNLFESDLYTVYTNRNVDGGLARIYDWYSLLNVARNTEDQDTYPDYFDGWWRSMDAGNPSERVITKPAILGGGVYLPAFTPSADVCGFGGDSNFYGVYFETGTAFYNPLLPNGLTDVAGQDYKVVKVKVPLGEGMPPPAVGIHAGREKGAKAFLQMSTGEVVEIEIETPFNIKSGLTTWRTN